MKDWGNREKLKGKLIEALVGEVDGSDIFGIVNANETVSYPVMGTDVLEAIQYIRDRYIIGKFGDLAKLSDVEAKCSLDIPIEDKTKYGRPTPRIFLELRRASGNQTLYGNLSHIYDGREKIFDFRSDAYFHKK